MKKYQNSLLLLFVILLAVGCGSASSETPIKTNVVKKQLEGKKAELDQLQFEVRELEKQLSLLDPTYKDKAEEKKARLVSSMELKRKDFDRFVEFQGSVTTKGEYMVSSELGGTVVSLVVKEGQSVRKGQLIGKVDDSVLRDNLAELEVSLNLARDLVGKRKALISNDNDALQKSIDELDVSIDLARSMVEQRKNFIGRDKESLQKSKDELLVALDLARNMVRQRQNFIKQDKESLQKSKDEVRVALNLAKDVFQRREKLWNQKIGSELEFIQAKNNVESLEKKLATLDAQITKAHTGQDIELLGAKNQVESLEKKIATLDAQISKSYVGQDMELLNAKKQLESLQRKKATLLAQVNKANSGQDIEMKTAENQVQTLEKKRATLETQLNKTNIYAPASGMVDLIMVKQGEISGPGMPILKIVNTSDLKVVCDVPEKYLPSIQKGNPVVVEIPVLEMEMNAKIDKIGGLIDPNNRTFDIEIGIRKKSRSIKPNLMATVKVVESTASGAVVVPSNLVQYEGERAYIYVVGEDEQTKKLIAQKIYVETGNAFRGEIPILSGLTGDEQIITDGARTAYNGERIKTVN